MGYFLTIYQLYSLHNVESYLWDKLTRLWEANMRYFKIFSGSFPQKLGNPH
jgi:hypothetical protein